MGMLDCTPQHQIDLKVIALNKRLLGKCEFSVVKAEQTLRPRAIFEEGQMISFYTNADRFNPEEPTVDMLDGFIYGKEIICVIDLDQWAISDLSSAMSFTFKETMGNNVSLIEGITFESAITRYIDSEVFYESNGQAYNLISDVWDGQDLDVKYTKTIAHEECSLNCMATYEEPYFITPSLYRKKYVNIVVHFEDTVKDPTVNVIVGAEINNTLTGYRDYDTNLADAIGPLNDAGEGQYNYINLHDDSTMGF